MEYSLKSAREVLTEQYFFESMGKDLWLHNRSRANIRRDMPLKYEQLLIIIPLKGKIECSVDFEKYTCTPNTIGLMLPQQTVQIHTISDDFRGVFFHVSTNFLDLMRQHSLNISALYFKIKRKPLLMLLEEESLFLLNCYMLLLQVIKDEDFPGKDKVALSILTTAFYRIESLYMKQESFDAGTKSRKQSIFENLNKLVSVFYKKSRSVKFYAEKLYVTPKYLSTCVKDITGKGTLDLITDYVMLEAKAQLKNTSKTVSEISSDLNFANPSFFCKYFRNNAGMSPERYREN
ncbi:MAG: helix-turn-helix domain-containing protein [Bacteroidales bacterium]|nr:helix-turn-helix domain-containing protein [Bacteroidales bacterium]